MTRHRLIPDRIADAVPGRLFDGVAVPGRLVDAIVPDRLVAGRTGPAVLADERATSPTIGAVLLIAITVLLVTATGTHLFGLADGQSTTFATATVEFSEDQDRVTVTWLANADAEKLKVHVRVGQDRRTVLLQGVGDEAVADGDGVTVSSKTVGHWDSPAISDGDRVSVTVIAVKDDERTVVAEQSGEV